MSLAVAAQMGRNVCRDAGGAVREGSVADETAPEGTHTGTQAHTHDAFTMTVEEAAVRLGKERRDRAALCALGPATQHPGSGPQ